MLLLKMVFVTAKALKVFNKCQTAALQNSATAESFLRLKREKKKLSRFQEIAIY